MIKIKDNDTLTISHIKNQTHLMSFLKHKSGVRMFYLALGLGFFSICINDCHNACDCFDAF